MTRSFFLMKTSFVSVSSHCARSGTGMLHFSLTGKDNLWLDFPHTSNHLQFERFEVPRATKRLTGKPIFTMHRGESRHSLER